ncbi:MAG: glycerophosphodiester phosphodiesterase [Acidobacteria bacterium]|nr:MAG: glycerophosphodiester phosphodiesterase [Acidobacteriota bacterium]
MASPLIDSRIGFAHRGGRKHGKDNTIECFESALEMGANGLETDIWLTRDGVAVLEHSGLVRSGLIPRPISWTKFGALPSEIPRLEDFYKRLGTDFELSIDIKAGIAGAEAIAIAGDAEVEALSRLWLCHWDLKRLRAWRLTSPDVRLVNSVRKLTIREGIEKRARRLAAVGIDALNLRADEWTVRDVEVLHAHGILAFGWNAHDAKTLAGLLELGIDAVYSDDVPMMVELLG